MISQVANITSHSKSQCVPCNPREDSESEDEGSPLADLESMDEKGEDMGEAGSPYTIPEHRIIRKWIGEHSKAEWEKNVH